MASGTESALTSNASAQLGWFMEMGLLIIIVNQEINATLPSSFSIAC
jgi:hypothetical protein